jgi:hypothetical protein
VRRRGHASRAGAREPRQGEGTAAGGTGPRGHKGAGPQGREGMGPQGHEAAGVRGPPGHGEHARGEEERGGGGRERERARERETERAGGRGKLTSGSKSGDYRLQNLGHNEGEREVEERKLLHGKKLNEDKGREGRGAWGGAGR